MALVTREAIRVLDDRLTLAQVVTSLAHRQVAAVALLGDADADAVAEADARRLPLLQLPAGVPLYELEQRLSRHIAEQRAVLYSKGLELQRRLADLSTSGRGMPALLRCLAETTGRVVVLAAPDWRVVETASVGQSLPTELVAELLAHAGAKRPGPLVSTGAEVPIVRGEHGALAVLTAGLVVRSRTAGALALIGPRDEVADLDRVALARASVVCVMEMAKQDAVVEAEHRLRGDLVAELIEAVNGNEPQLLARAQHLGYDLQRPHVALVVNLEQLVSANSTDGGRTSSAPCPGDLLRLATRLMQAEQCEAPAALREDELVVFVALASPHDVQAALRLASALLADDRCGAQLAVGLGRSYPGVIGLGESYREAAQAAIIGRQLFGPGRLVTFQELGAHRLLYALRNQPELAAFHDETLGALLEYDRRNGTEFLRTLEAYFAHGANLKATADALYLHRNSLSYRLRRISEVTGYNLDDLEARFRLQLALKARPLLRAPAAGGPGLRG
ncbi:MAG: helix-turn-helix domain-containing protein [Chloroflexi bacterium]|nr:helix-turn-helix domain-containing protein [Chloroflexota bacterium]